MAYSLAAEIINNLTMAPPLVIRDKALVAIIIFTVKPKDRLRSVRRMTLLSCSFGKRYVSALSILWWYGSIRIGSGGAAGWLYIFLVPIIRHWIFSSSSQAIRCYYPCLSKGPAFAVIFVCLMRQIYCGCLRR